MIVTPDNMKIIDLDTIKMGISGIVLMEQAGIKCYNEIKKIYFEKNIRKIIIFCGTGNNGGDGFVIARKLLLDNIDFEIYIVGNKEKISNEAKINYNILINLGVEIKVFDKNICFENVFIIDAILGTGIKGNLRKSYVEVIEKINKSNSFVVSIDVPSCLKSFKSFPLKDIFIIKANVTLAIGCYKTIFFDINGIRNIGELKLIKLDFPEKILKKNSNNIYINKFYKDDFLKLKKKDFVNKGSNGKIFIFAGSYKYSGAAILAAKSAVECGAGLVFLLCPDVIQDIVKKNLPEVIVISLETENNEIIYSNKNQILIKEYLDKTNSVIVGPGLSIGLDLKKLILFIIKNTENPILIDADGLNNISNDLSIIFDKSNIVLTPHPGELSRLINKNIDFIVNNRLEVLKLFPENISIILKGKYSVIKLLKKQYVNFSGNSLLAVAGSGDVLSGIIGTFLGKYKFDFAIKMGVYLHGYISDYLYREKKYMFIKSSDIIDNIKNVIEFILK